METKKTFQGRSQNLLVASSKQGEQSSLLVKDQQGKKNIFLQNYLLKLPSLIFPDLIAIQYGSFQKFLNIGFTEAIETVNPIICKYNNNKLKIQFFPDQIQFRRPDENSKYSIYFGKTYGCAVYIPALISSIQDNETKIEWLFLGFLPIMTNAGHFIINGIPRIVLHQMVRNPGVYTLPNDSRTRVPTIRIVPEQGSWINITIDKKNRVWITTRILRRKLSILIFLQALGISFDDLKNRINHADLLAYSFIKPLKSNEKTRHGRILQRAGLKSHPQTKNEACRYIFAHIQEYTAVGRDQIISDDIAIHFFNEVVWNPKNRNLGSIGREQFRQKFKSTVSISHTILTTTDLINSSEALLHLICSEKQGDDIDSLNNKRIRGCGDFLKDQLIRGIKEFEVHLNRKLSLTTQIETETVWKLQKSSLSKYVSKSWKSFFTSGTLSQFLDETNPLAEATHKRRITVLGLGGVSSKQTTIQIRGIHPTYYGRLCPIETPEGQNAGLVNSLTVFARPNELGYLETPFYRVYRGQVQRFIKPKFYVPYEESSFLLAPSDIKISETLTFPRTELPLRKNWHFDYGIWNKITNQSVSLLQMISVATSLIPFLEHDDANRALMGSNMQRQAVPLLQPEPAYVQTGLEGRVISDVQHSFHTKSTGYVTNVTSKSIQIFTPKNKLPIRNKKSTIIYSLNKLSYNQRNSVSSFGQTKFIFQKILTKNILVPKSLTISSSRRNFKKFKKSTNDFDYLKIINSLEFYQRTNQSTCKYNQPIVSPGQWVQKSDIIADGGASFGGKMALGKNIVVAYLPWEGYNFEDAILISNRLVQEDLFTSLHIDYYEIEVKNTQYGLETITNEVPIEVTDSDRDILRIQRLQPNGLISIGAWVQEGDYLIGKITPMNPKGPSVQQQYEKLYNIIMQRENTNFRNTSLRVPKGVEGFVFAVHILPPKEADVIAVAPKNAILRVRIALVQKRKVQVGDKMAGRHGNKGIISKILPAYNMPYLPDGRPIDIILNPLGVPSRMNVGQIFECLLGLAGYYLNESYTINLFDEQMGSEASRSFVYSKLLEASIQTKNPWLFEPHHPGKMKLFDGRTGQPFDQAITVGCTYMLKLVHLVDDKLHARGTGPYSVITQQPVRGRSRNGGQRLGEMEVWALQAYGAASILQELLTIKSDDVDGRKEAVFQIYTNQPIKFGPPESFRVLIRELQALCFDLKIFGWNKNTDTFQAFNVQFLERFSALRN